MGMATFYGWEGPPSVASEIVSCSLAAVKANASDGLQRPPLAGVKETAPKADPASDSDA